MVRAILVICLAAVSVGFSRSAVDSFDLTKATLVWGFGILMLPLGIAIWLNQRSRVVTRSLGTIVLLGFSVATLLSAAISDFVWPSLWGQYQRYTGVFTVLSCVVFACLVADQVRVHGARWFLTAVVSVQSAVNVYGLLQWSNHDPWEWQSQSFGRLVFSTLGNPNTASAYTAATLPIVLYLVGSAKDSIVRVGSMLVAATSMFLLTVYDSFQGTVALLMTLVAALCLPWLGGWSSRGYLASGWVIGSLVVFWLQPESGFGLALVVAVGLVLGVVVQPFDRQWIQPSTGVLFGAASAVLSAFLVVLVTQFDAIQQQIESGLSERRFFYSAAGRMIRERPIFGWGTETFGFWFTSFRPRENAEVLETSITSSVHSVPLGMFISGGVLLGVAFLGLVGRFVVYPTWRAVWTREPSATLFVAMSCWAWLIASLVSVESIHLFVLFAFLVGGLTQTELVPVKMGRKTVKKKAFRTDGWALAIGVILLLVLSPFWTAFLRADQANLRGLMFSASGNVPQAVNEFSSASSLASWNGEYRAKLALSLNQIGDVEPAAVEAVRAADDMNYPNTLVTDLALVALNGGDTDGGILILQRALANDPYAPGLRARVTDISRQLVTFLEEQGDQARVDSLRAWMSQQGLAL